VIFQKTHHRALQQPAFSRVPQSTVVLAIEKKVFPNNSTLEIICYFPISMLPNCTIAVAVILLLSCESYGSTHYGRVIIQKRRKEGAEMNIAFLIGRIIFATFWLMGSFNHFKNLNYMSEYAKARGTPSPKAAVAGTGVILLLGGLSMLLGVYPVVGIILLIVFLLGVSFQMHAYWKMDDAQMKQIDMINFTKNMALVGALLMFLLLPHPWPMSLGIG
jgi:putative oxidoreductase